MEMSREENGSHALIAGSRKLRRAIGLLLEGVQYANDTAVGRWEFAVEIDRLRRLGLSDNDLRFLVRRQYIEHASEITRRTRDTRAYRSVGDFHFTKRSCFVLTEAGVSMADGLPEKCPERLPAQSVPNRISPCYSHHSTSDVPIWDDQRRTLFLNGQVVKRFRWIAANQQMILSAFQEEGWPMRIDDPLIPSELLVSKQRLSDTIKCLNRKQENQLVRFRGDGSGQGIVWESAAERTFPLAAS